MRRFFDDLVAVNDCLVPEQPPIVPRPKAAEEGAAAGSMAQYYQRNVLQEKVISPSWQWPSQKRINTQVKFHTVMLSLVEVYLIVETLLSQQSLFQMAGFSPILRLATQTKAALSSIWPSLALPLPACLSYMLFIKVVMPQAMEHNYLKCSTMQQLVDDYVVPGKVKDVLKRIFFSMHSLGILSNLNNSASLLDIAQFLVTFPYLHSHETDKKGVQLTLLAQYLHSLIPQLPPEYLHGNSVKLYTELMLEYHSKYQLKWLQAERNLELLLVAEHVMEKHLADIGSEEKTLKAFKRSSDFFAFILRARIPVRVRKVRESEGATRLTVEKCTSPNCPSTVLAFLQEFCALAEVQRCTECEADEGGVRAAFAQYLELMRAKLMEHPQYVHRTPSEVDEVFDDLVRYITRKLFKEVFPPWKSKADKAFLTVCEDLDWVRPQHLSLDLSLPNHMFSEAVRLLRSVDDFLSPHSKVLKMVEAVTLVLSEADFWVEGETMENPDCALPYVVLLVVLTQATRFWSNVNYIAKFWHPVQTEKQPWLCYCLLKSAAHFLETADASTFHLCLSSYQQFLSDSRQRHGRT